MKSTRFLSKSGIPRILFWVQSKLWKADGATSRFKGVYYQIFEMIQICCSRKNAFYAVGCQGQVLKRKKRASNFCAPSAFLPVAATAAATLNKNFESVILTTEPRASLFASKTSVCRLFYERRV